MALSLPNLISVMRLLLVPLIVSLMLGKDYELAFAVFLVAGISDAVDGFIAKRFDLMTTLGAYLDPIADKLIVCAALVMLVKDGTIHDYTVIAAIVIVSREILLSGLREYLAAAQVKVRVSRIAKLKTTIQMVAICVLIGAPPVIPHWPHIDLAGAIGLWVAAALTVYTGWGYLVASLKYMED